MPISDILRWLVVALLVLAVVVVLVWPGLNHLARVVALVGCACGILMAVLLSQPFLWAFLVCTGVAALIGMIRPHNQHRREWPELTREQMEAPTMEHERIR